ncbi:MAG: hypothetical protein E6X17_06070 [Sporomusaceae bacterium]|nr:hypothetical protein [Sporomusaceae bacterium]
MAETNFKVFNEELSPDRTFSDAEYNVATQRQGGVIPGMALSRLHNKLYRQSTAMAKAIADFIVEQGYDCMDNDIPGITAAIGAAIQKTAEDAASEAVTEHNTDSDAHELATRFGTSGHNHNGTAGQGPKLTDAGLAAGAATDAVIGNRTVNQALAGPGNTGTLTQLLSWMAGRIKAITGATNWYDAPVKSIAELEAGKAPKLNLSTTGSTVIGVGTLAGGWDSVPNSCMNIVLSAANEIHLSFKLPDGTKRTIKLPFNATLDTIIAKLESPAFTGTPTAPTAAAGASTKQIANTEFVQGAVSGIEGTRVWKSGEYIPIVNTPTIVTHGISGLNLLYARGEVLLKCVTADGGYAVGDYAIGWSSTSNASGNGSQIIPVPLLTDTTIQYNTGDYTSATTNGIIMASKNSGAHFKATLANWRYVFRIFY